MKIRDKTLFVRHLLQRWQFHLLWNLIQQRTGRPGSTFDLPKRCPPMHLFTEIIEGANLAEQYELGFMQCRDTADQIFDPLERIFLPLTNNLFRSGLPQREDVTKADAETRNVLAILNSAFDRAVPFRLERVDGFHTQTVELCIMYQHCRTVKAHRLIVEQRRSERREIMKFQIRAGIGDQCETRRMGFREPVAREGSNLRDDLFLGFRTESVHGHAAPQLCINFPTMGPGRMMATCTTRS